MTKKLVLPVPQGFFRCPPLTPAAKRRYVRHGQRALVDLVQKSQLCNGPIEWTLDHETSGVRVYCGHDPETSSLVYLNVTDIHATLEEAAALMSAGDGSRDYCATYLDNILDAQPLYTITTPTEDHPHNAVTIKWRVLSSKSALVRNRDMVVLEIQDDFTVNGINGFARCIRSVDVGEACPDLEGAFGLVRAQVHLDGDLFMESIHAGFVTVCRIYQSDLKGSVPSWLTAFLSKRRVAKCIASMDSHFRHTRLLKAGPHFLPEEALQPMEVVTHCTTCVVRFSPLVRKCHCHVCGQVMCKKCSLLWDVRRAAALMSTASIRVCRSCSAANPSNQSPTNSQSFMASYATGGSGGTSTHRKSSPLVKVLDTFPKLDVSISARYEKEFRPAADAALWQDLEQADSSADMLGLLRQLQELKHTDEKLPSKEKRILLTN
ncbi:hypothetical protein AeMF1_019874 [Aphanomyces euteiches]|nr:hypothetical protein AeMF1_019874 [Aphanomyces euteiches]KAH9190092.1 hypothetical protein AeNC1_007932 [Aphanomyces euteiches]